MQRDLASLGSHVCGKHFPFAPEGAPDGKPVPAAVGQSGRSERLTLSDGESAPPLFESIDFAAYDQPSAMANPSPERCAVYSRKSSEEGLEQDFNSLHAQREGGEAFIKSQVAEGWRLIKTAYNGPEVTIAVIRALPTSRRR